MSTCFENLWHCGRRHKHHGKIDGVGDPFERGVNGLAMEFTVFPSHEVHLTGKRREVFGDPVSELRGVGRCSYEHDSFGFEERGEHHEETLMLGDRRPAATKRL